MKTLALVLASLLFTLLGCELVLALFWHNPYQGTGASSVVTLRTNARNLNQTHDRRRFDAASPEVSFRTDNKGYILPSRQFAKPDYSVAFLGGSTTEMSLVAENKRFPALVSTLLGESGLQVNTFNAGRSGNTLHDSINSLFNVVNLEQPDFVVVMHATNDQGLLQKDSDYRTRSAAPVTAGNIATFTLQSLSGKSRIVGLVRQVYTVSQARGAQQAKAAGDTLTAEAAQPFSARLRILVSMARELGMTPILMTQPHASVKNELTPGWANSENQQLFNNAIRSIASDMQVTLIDLDLSLSSTPGFAEKPLTLLYDGMHATDKGSEVMAQAIAQVLIELMGSQGREARATKPDQ